MNCGKKCHALNLHCQIINILHLQVYLLKINILLIGNVNLIEFHHAACCRVNTRREIMHFWKIFHWEFIFSVLIRNFLLTKFLSLLIKMALEIISALLY